MAQPGMSRLTIGAFREVLAQTRSVQTTYAVLLAAVVGAFSDPSDSKDL